MQNITCQAYVETSTLYKRIQLLAGWVYGTRPFGPKEIDGLLVPPGKASTLLTDHLLTG